MAAKAVWAHDLFDNTDIKHLSGLLRVGMGTAHWSRMFEYPWIMLNASLQKTDVVLDAAGGDSVLQVLMACASRVVFNIDQSHEQLHTAWKRYHKDQAFRRVIHQIGDIQNLWIIPDDFFDKVVCVSVLEHINPPEPALIELWRVLKPGGRLLVTMDVTPYGRYNHSVDDKRASTILREFGLELPPSPKNILEVIFDEPDPEPGESSEVSVRCLCFYCDKE